MSTTTTHFTPPDPITAPQLAVLLPIQRHHIGTEPAVLLSQLYHALDIRKDFTNWAKSQFKRAMLVQGADFEVYAQKGEKSKGGRPAIDWLITIDAAKHVALMSATARGALVRRYFIDAERELRNGVMAKGAHALEKLAGLLRARRALEAEGSQAGRVLGGLRHKRVANDEAQQMQLELLMDILPGVEVLQCRA